MRAFLASERVVHVPLRTFFDRPPEEQVAQVLRDGWLITALMPTAEELAAHRAEKKTELKGDLEELRKKLVAEGVTYEAQLEVERAGLLNAGLALFERFARALSSGQPPTIWDLLGATALASPIRMWRELGGAPEALGPFLSSPYLNSMPLPARGRNGPHGHLRPQAVRLPRLRSGIERELRALLRAAECTRGALRRGAPRQQLGARSI
jgi:hypothetical protein